MAEASWNKNEKETKIIINGEEWVPSSSLTSYNSSYENELLQNKLKIAVEALYNIYRRKSPRECDYLEYDIAKEALKQIKGR